MYIADDILGKRTNVYKALKDANFENDSNFYTPIEFRKQIMAIVEPNLPKGKSGQDAIAKLTESSSWKQRDKIQKLFSVS